MEEDDEDNKTSNNNSEHISFDNFLVNKMEKSDGRKGEFKKVDKQDFEAEEHPDEVLVLSPHASLTTGTSSRMNNDSTDIKKKKNISQPADSPTVQTKRRAHGGSGGTGTGKGSSWVEKQQLLGRIPILSHHTTNMVPNENFAAVGTTVSPPSPPSREPLAVFDGQTASTVGSRMTKFGIGMKHSKTDSVASSVSSSTRSKQLAMAPSHTDNNDGDGDFDADDHRDDPTPQRTTVNEENEQQNMETTSWSTPGAYAHFPFGHEPNQDENYTVNNENLDTEPTFAPNQQQEQQQPSSANLIEAQLVTEQDQPVLITAKPDPWWRRYQWFILGGILVIVVVFIVMGVIFGLGLQNRNNSSPNEIQGESLLSPSAVSLSSLIVQRFPVSMDALQDVNSPQFQALLFVADGNNGQGNDTDTITNNNETSIVVSVMRDSIPPNANNTFVLSQLSDEELLQRFSLAAMFFSTQRKITAQNESESTFPLLKWTTLEARQHVCDWTAISCNNINVTSNNDMLVSSISIATNLGLIGTLPQELALLSSSLVHLEISQNPLLRSVIPTRVGLLSRLTRLHLTENALWSQVPSELGQLSTTLTDLNVSGNVLTGALPTTFGDLSVLKYLDASRNDFIGGIPTEMGQVTTLEQMDISYNRLSETIPSQMGRLSLLKSLLLHDNPAFCGTLPTEVAGMTSLQVWNMANNRVTGRIPTHIGLLLGNLTFLDWTGNSLSGTLPSVLLYGRPEQSQQLQTLRLGSNFLEGSLPRIVPQASRDAIKSRVKHLDLSENFFNDRLPTGFDQILAGLEYLNLTGNLLEGDLSSSLGKLSQLKTLSLADNRFVGSLPFNLSKDLLLLELHGNSFVGSIGNDNIRNLTRLRHLNLRGNDLTGTVSALLPRSLQFLDLARNKIRALPPNLLGGGDLSNLVHLDMSRNSNLRVSLSGDGIARLNNSLQHLDFTDTDIVTRLSSSMGLLTKLTLLDFRRNDIIGPIPDLSRLSNLRLLNLASNDITGTLFELGALSKLTTLALNSNFRLAGNLTSGIGNLTLLKSFELGFTDLTGTIPTEIALLTDLSKIQWSSIEFTNIPSEIYRLTGLTSLWFSSDTIGGTISTLIGNMVNLTRLWLTNEHTGTIPTEVGYLKRLRAINFAGNSLVGTIPSEIGNLVDLIEINLNANQLSGELPSDTFGNLTNLREFYVRGNPIRGRIPDDFNSLKKIRNAWLDRTDIMGTVPRGWCDNEDVMIEVDCEDVVCYCCEECGPPPTVSPSPTTSSTVVVTLFILFNALPSTISWTVRDPNDVVVYESPRDGYEGIEFLFGRLFLELFLDENTEYTFRIESGFGRGLCDDNPRTRDGFYNLYLGREPDENTVLVCGRCSFRSFATHRFTPGAENLISNCINGDISPSTQPSATPTMIPSNIPTISPFPTREGAFLVTLLMQLDENSKFQNSWTITTTDGATEINPVTSSLNEQTLQFTAIYSLERDREYSFFISDSRRNGIDDGYIVIYAGKEGLDLNSVLACSTGSFRRRLTLLFNTSESSAFQCLGVVPSPSPSQSPSQSFQPSFSVLPSIEPSLSFAPTEAPTLSIMPTTTFFPTEDGTVLVTLVIQLDRSPNSNRWVFSYANGTIIEVGGNYTFRNFEEKIVRRYFLNEDDVVMFEIFDRFRNGICCRRGNGYYRLFRGRDERLDRVLICGDGEFGQYANATVSLAENIFLDCIDPQDLVPTASPTQTISPAPSFQPSVSPTGESAVIVSLVIQFDFFPEDVGVELKGGTNTSEVVESQSFEDVRRNRKVSISWILDSTLTYSFRISDMFGDGICCERGRGYYRIYLGDDETIDNVLVCGNGQFGSNATHSFSPNTENLVHCNFLSNSPSVTPSTSLSPTTDGTVIITIVLNLGSAPSGISWVLSHQNETAIGRSPPYRLDVANRKVTDRFVVKRADDLELKISNNFGLASFGRRQGFYRVFLGPFEDDDRVLVCGGNDPQFETTHNFRADVNSIVKDCVNVVPTSAPSSSPSAVPMGRVILTVRLTLFPQAVSWTLFDDTDGSVVATSPGYGIFDFNDEFRYAFNLDPNRQYTFFIEDRTGAGLSPPRGYYRIYLKSEDDDSVLVCGRGGFGFNETTSFAPREENIVEDCVSVIPSASPSISPTMAAPTTPPSMFLSSSPSLSVEPTAPGSVIVLLVIQYDRFPMETSWKVRTVVGSGILYDSESSFPDQAKVANTKFEEQLLLQEGTEYEFEIEDSGGDGICCIFSQGFYRLYQGRVARDDRVLFSGDGEFGSRMSHTFTINAS